MFSELLSATVPLDSAPADGISLPISGKHCEHATSSQISVSEIISGKIMTGPRSYTQRETKRLAQTHNRPENIVPVIQPL
jgi:hypothetical protein